MALLVVSVTPAAELVPDAAARQGDHAEAPEEASLVDAVEPSRRYSVDVNWTPQYEVDFKSGPITPDPGLDPALAEAEGRTWVLLQFHEEQPRRHLENLSDYEITLGEDLTATTVAAGVPAEQLEPLAAEEAVRAVADMGPATRCAPTIDAAVEDGRLGPETATEVHVYGYEALEDDRLEAVEGDDEPHYVGDLTLSDVEDLQQDNRVRWITVRGTPTPDLAESRDLVGAPGDDTPTAYSGGGANWGGHYDGHGVLVGVVDTGFETSHPHFNDVNVTGVRDYLGNDGDPSGPYDHGTHVAGTITGTTRPADLDGSDLALQGVAPQTDLVVSRAIKQGQDAKKAPPDWFDKLAGQGDVEVISNSWGYDGGGGDYTKATKNADVWARDHPGTLLVFTNGNSPDQDSTNAYGRGVNVLTVSAVNDGSVPHGAASERDRRQAVTPSDVLQTANTSTLLTTMDTPKDVSDGGIGQIKPELLAPGEGIHAPSNNTNHSVFGGTSMAAPHVAGAASLVEDATDAAGWDVSANQMRAMLVESATPSRGGSGSYYTKGFGVVHAHDAMFENKYEAEDDVLHVGEGMTKKDAIVRTITIPKDATKVSATLSWLDPTKTPKTHTALSNNIFLILGPKSELPDASVRDPDVWEGSKWVHGAKRNVKQLSFEDPQPGTWVVGGYGREVTFGTDQPFDVAYTIETADPGIAADTLRDTVQVKDEDKVNLTLEVEGTGAPAAGTYARYGPLEDPLEGCGVGTSPGGGAVLGTLSDGRRQRIPLCLDTSKLPAPGGGASQDYEGQVNVTWTGGQETVTFTVQRAEEDPPTDVRNIRSSSHGDAVRNRTWSRFPQLHVEWDPASDTGSGVHKYYTAITRDSSSQLPLDPKPGFLNRTHPNDTHPHTLLNHTTFWLGPDENPDVPARFKRFANETPDVREGEYWFHVRSVDNASNLASTTSHYGPIKFDTVAPTATFSFTGENTTERGPDQPAVAAVDSWVLLGASNATDGGKIASYDWYIEQSDGDGGTNWTRVVDFAYETGGYKTYFNWSESGTYTVNLTVVDEAGNRGSVERQIVVGTRSDAAGAPAPGALTAAVALAGAALGARRRRP